MISACRSCFFMRPYPKQLRQAEIMWHPVHAAINNRRLANLCPNLRSIIPHLGKPGIAEPIGADEVRWAARDLDDRLSVCRSILAEMAAGLPKDVRNSTLINRDRRHVEPQRRSNVEPFLGQRPAGGDIETRIVDRPAARRGSLVLHEQHDAT